MTNKETVIDIYFILNILILIMSMVAIVLGVNLNDSVTIIIGSALLIISVVIAFFGVILNYGVILIIESVWLIISLLRLFVIFDRKSEIERRPLLGRVLVSRV